MALGLTPEEFGAWRSHPATQKVFKYLRDRRDDLAKRWVEGETMDDNAQVYAQMYGDLAEMSFDDIAEFYDESTGDDDDVTDPGD